MSTYASLTCKEHDHLIDVAWSFVDYEVRLWVDDKEDMQETTTYLTIKQAEHLIELMQLAIKNIKKSNGYQER